MRSKLLPGITVLITMFALSSACILDFRDGLACAVAEDCNDYYCVNGVCTSPDDAVPLDKCLQWTRFYPQFGSSPGVCTAGCEWEPNSVAFRVACPETLLGASSHCEALPNDEQPAGRNIGLCNSDSGGAAMASNFPPCSTDADCVGTFMTK